MGTNLELHLTPTESQAIMILANYANRNQFKVIRYKDESLTVQEYRDKYHKATRTPTLVAQNGWLTKEQIEYPEKGQKKLYPNPDKDRWELLDKSLTQEKQILEIRSYEYQNRKGVWHPKVPGKASKKMSGDKMYRIRQDKETYLKLHCWYAGKAHFPFFFTTYTDFMYFEKKALKDTLDSFAYFMYAYDHEGQVFRSPLHGDSIDLHFLSTMPIFTEFILDNEVAKNAMVALNTVMEQAYPDDPARSDKINLMFAMWSYLVSYGRTGGGNFSVMSSKIIERILHKERLLFYLDDDLKFGINKETKERRNNGTK